ncbi:MAG: hypothetical protein EOP88_23540 [Verrucomicrobiaceae bacterium]|nr:MAG: hypothetical protein EOP88_23540 [Verrucomicrobiaceae bacterium]
MNVIENVFEWLLAATLRASVLAVLILCIQMVLRRWLSAGWRHALWLPMVAVLVLPVLPETPFGLFPLKREAVVELPKMEVMAAEGPGESSSPAAASVAKPETKVNYLALLWLTGACGVMGAGLLGYRTNLARVRAAATGPDRDLAEDLEVAALQAGLARAPQVMISSAVNSPAVTGFLRPVLLLPEGFPEGFSKEEARLILLHEFCHLKRLDLPLNWLACVLQAIHWFNPLLWFAFARMRADREAACDARVLSLDMRDRRSEYGGALLKLQCVAPTRAMSLGFVGIFERGGEMKARIRDISTHRRGHFAWQAVGGAILTGLMLFGVTRAQDETELPTADRAEAEGGSVAPEGANKMTEGVSYIMNKLNKIVVPSAELKDATLKEAAEFLMTRARDLDVEEKNPALKGVNVVVKDLKEGQPAYRNVTLNVKNLTLIKLMQEIAKHAGARFKVDDFAVTFLPEGDKGDDFVKIPGASAVPGGPEGAEKPGVILARVDFEEVSLMEAVQQLNTMAKEAAKGEPVPRVVLDGSGDPAAKVRELRLRNIPLSIAVKYCAEQTKHRVVAREGELRITREPAAPGAKAGAGDQAPEKAKPENEIPEAAMKIIIPKVEYEDSSLADAVDFLNLKAKEHANGMEAPVIVLDASADPAARVREIRIRNAPLWVVGTYAAEAAGHKLVADGKNLRVVKKP